MVDLQSAIDGLTIGSDELLAVQQPSPRERLTEALLGTTWDAPAASGWSELEFQPRMMLRTVPDELHRWVALSDREVVVVGSKVLLLRFDADLERCDAIVLRQPAPVRTGSPVK